MIARKISLAKWAGPEVGTEISADAVTGDLRTSDNALSFWSTQSHSPDELEDVVLALASAFQRIDKIDLAWVDPESLRSAGIGIGASEGLTPVESLKGRHVDVERLDLGRLGVVATAISAAVAQKSYRRWSSGEVLRILAKAVAEDRLDPARLTEEVKQKVLARLDPR